MSAFEHAHGSVIPNVLAGQSTRQPLVSMSKISVLARRLGLAIVGALIPSPTHAQITQRLNLSSAGSQANSGSISGPITPDGRFVAFDSYATNLVPGDTNGYWDVFIRDRERGTTTRVNLGQGGLQGEGGDSAVASISSDGRYVLFTSLAANLVQGDANATADVFLRDRQAGTTELLSVSSMGVQGDNYSIACAMTPNVRFVVFVSAASNLIPVNPHGGTQIYLRDRLTATTELVSLSQNGAPGNATSNNASISGDSRYVAFVSNATNLVAGGTNGNPDVFVRDRLVGSTEQVDVSSAGAQADYSDETEAHISDNGRYVVFSSAATNLVPGDTNNASDIFVRDLQLHATERVSVDVGGVQGMGASLHCCVSADGRFVAFTSSAANLVAGDTNGMWDVFIRDRQVGAVERVSVASDGTQGTGSSASQELHCSDDGRHVVFDSGAANLVQSDSNAHEDVFMRDRQGGPSFGSMCSPGMGGIAACPCSNPGSGPDRGCDNSAGTGGAMLAASGGAFLSSDSLEFSTHGERSASLSVLLQGTAPVPNGAIYGQGVRCVGGSLRRLYTKTAISGGIIAPNLGTGDPQASVRSAALGDLIQMGQSRWYLVYYRDPIVLGGCSPTSTFNCTQTGQVTWSP